MYMKACSKCSEMFGYNEGEDWKKTCLPCWLSTKNGAPKPSQAGLQSNEQKLAQDLAKARKMFEAEVVKNLQLQRELYMSQNSRVTNISKEDLKRIRMLVHPDKHSNSAMSNSMTQLINKLIN